MIKKVISSYKRITRHWVGDGFYVLGLLRTSGELNSIISPFIMIDYASPRNFPPSKSLKGVGKHPHRGFDTVTFAYQGEVQHRDSSGGGGIIKPGDVQWMTAGKGIVHDEFHSEDFSKKGGVFEMVQLWINLPKKYKMTSPSYQSIKKEQIPNIQLNKEVNIRLIAGNFLNLKGPAKTFTKINIMDIYSISKSKISINLEKKTSTILLILSGKIKYNNQLYTDRTVIIFDQEGTNLSFKTLGNFKGLLLNGEPIHETVVSHGPFVMNTKEEIDEAINDYQAGKMGNFF